MPLQGKVAIVTGGGRGIGEAIALQLGSDGAAVVVWDIQAGPAEAVVQAVVQKVKTAGGIALAALRDVTDLARVQDGCA